MRTRVISALAATGAAAALAFAASPAHAATWTIAGSSDDGSVSASAGTTTLTDTNTGVALTCASSTATATAANGTYADGANIAQIGSLGFTSCSGPFGLSFTVATSGFPWAINADTPISGGASGTISGIQAHLTGTGCDATVAGSVPGTVTGDGTNATLSVLAQGDTLTVTNVDSANNCFGLIATGDVVQFAGAYAITPGTLTITGA